MKQTKKELKEENERDDRQMDIRAEVVGNE